MKRQVSWQSRKRYSEKGESAKRRTEQNAVCVFRIKGRSIVDFPGRYLSDSSRHSWRHLRFSILRKRYLQRIKSFTSCAELEKSNEAFVGSTNGVSLPEPVTNAIRKIAAPGTGIALLFAGEGTMQKIQITIERRAEVRGIAHTFYPRRSAKKVQHSNIDDRYLAFMRILVPIKLIFISFKRIF
ncbi:hypothetical protein ALC53_02818 [Atta colombica]|uniref:Uncharacterized protein n=1 Tax=Atta colombica TaxID=520822 RepID=A0A195BQU8_9HYME|nr:hypothetical protein ALC53_02818 [Atta colombica]